MLKENLKDAGEIIQNILTQPLSIPDMEETVTLLSAAQSYQINEGENSALSKAMLSLLLYPEPTQIMLRELDILYKEINV